MIYKKDLKAPFPWFGGKSSIASVVWERFGNVANYVEPFFGSGAVLLANPNPCIETVNDIDGFVSNFWRSTKLKPKETAHHADWPVNENDLNARHIWLVNNSHDLVSRLEGNPMFCDPKIAGWWVWGLCCWIGSGWCSGDGPWRSVDGVMMKSDIGDTGRGINRKRPHLSDAGQGVNRQRIDIQQCFAELSERLSSVRVCCGDWSRVCGDTPTIHNGLTAVFLDPPYGDNAGRDMNLYTCDSGTVASDVGRWAIERGDDPMMRIALCGYEGEHKMPDSWDCFEWKAAGGYGSQGDNAARNNAHRERIWFSPHCLIPGQRDTRAEKKRIDVLRKMRLKF